jgi:hypothetical protein
MAWLTGFRLRDRNQPGACGRNLRSSQATPDLSQKLLQPIMGGSYTCFLGRGWFANRLDQISHAALLM